MKFQDLDTVVMVSVIVGFIMLAVAIAYESSGHHKIRSCVKLCRFEHEGSIYECKKQEQVK